jgi:hypothetical protein
VGGVPAGWTALKQLRVLELTRNAGISGSLRNLLVALPGLQHLDVSHTGITGALTGAAVSAMSALTGLKLSKTPLNCLLPRALPTSLVHLSAREAGLRGTLEAVKWTRLGALRNLALSGNALIGTCCMCLDRRRTRGQPQPAARSPLCVH